MSRRLNINFVRARRFFRLRMIFLPRHFPQLRPPFFRRLTIAESFAKIDNARCALCLARLASVRLINNVILTDGQGLCQGLDEDSLPAKSGFFHFKNKFRLV